MRCRGHVRGVLVAVLVVLGATPVGLVIAGEPRPAIVAWSISDRGARNRTWRIAYRYVVDGRTYRGVSRGARPLAAGVRVEIRTLPALPRVASALTNGALLFWGLLAWSAAALLWMIPAALARPRPRAHVANGGPGRE